MHNWHKLYLLPLLLLAQIALAQPESPQPQTCGPHWMGGCWDYNHRTLTTAETFEAKRFWIPTALWLASDVFDAEATHQGLSRGVCAEGNPYLPPYPTRGQLYAHVAKTELPLIGLGWVFSKLNRKVPSAIYFGMTAYVVQMHARAGLNWVRNCY